jgi:hypothetical protein
MVFMPGETICEIGEISNEMLFIIEGLIERNCLGETSESEMK